MIHFYQLSSRRRLTASRPMSDVCDVSDYGQSVVDLDNDEYSSKEPWAEKA